MLSNQLLQAMLNRIIGGWTKGTLIKPCIIHSGFSCADFGLCQDQPCIHCVSQVLYRPWNSAAIFQGSFHHRLVSRREGGGRGGYCSHFAVSKNNSVFNPKGKSFVFLIGFFNDCDLNMSKCIFWPNVFISVSLSATTISWSEQSRAECEPVIHD